LSSSSAELDEMTTPDFLAVFAEMHPTAHGLLLDRKEKRAAARRYLL